MKLSEAIAKVEEFVGIVKITDAQTQHSIPGTVGLKVIWFDFESMFKDRLITGSFSIAQTSEGFNPDSLYADWVRGESAFNLSWKDSEFIPVVEDVES